MLVSIIIPVYNSGEYLPRCLDSIISSGIEDMEILLIDDSSTDGSSELCAGYACRYPFVSVYRKENGGPSAARNFGLEHAAGEYVAFLDSDDYVDSKAFAKTVSLLPDYDVDIWVSDFYRVADNGCVLDRVYQIKESTEPITEAAYVNSFLSAGDCVWNVWRCIFRRDYLERCGLRFIEGVHCAEDVEFMVRALTYTERRAFFHNPYYHYRVNYGQTLTRLYTVQRVQQLMDMLLLSAEHLQHQQTEAAQLIINKLAREYILNLHLLAQLPVQQRPAALSALYSAAKLLDMAEGRLYSLARRILSTFGIPPAAYALFAMKCGKRSLRRIKAAMHNKVKIGR